MMCGLLHFMETVNKLRKWYFLNKLYGLRFVQQENLLMILLSFLKSAQMILNVFLSNKEYF